MPITLNHSNIGVQYSTGSNYIIETVKSDLYRRNEIYDNIVRDNIQVAPVTPSIYIENGTNNVYAVESYTYSGSANTADFTRVFPKSTTCDILVVAGGGGGGNDRGGGGGGGGVIYSQNITLNGTYTINVGKGGIGTTSGIPSGNGTRGTNGINSSISGSGLTTLTAIGGGGGGACASGLRDGLSGGSGGGGSQYGGAGSGGTGTIGQGNNGGIGFEQGAAGGGGGAGAVGTNANSTNAGNGGIGLSNSIIGTTVIYGSGGGGGGSAGSGIAPQVFGTGGSIGAGNGGNGHINGNNATVFGCGGGGAGIAQTSVTTGGNGFAGIVIIRYLLGTIPATNYLTNEPVVIAPAFTETIRSFTHSGGAETQTTYTITVGQNTICDILIVAGGGGGGPGHGGGGGAGQLILIHQAILNGTYTINVGKGGIGGRSSELANSFPATKGSNSSFGTVIAEGGGANTNVASDKDGGSGAGGDGYNADGGTSGFGNKNTTIDTFPGATLYSRGNNGGSNTGGTGGGGGGAGTAAPTGSSTTPFSIGGDGLSGISDINYDFKTNFGNYGKLESDGNYWFAGGGGGGASSVSAFGGKGGGGNGSNNPATVGNATNNTGSGGGGGSGGSGSGGSGGSGIVIIRFKSIVNVGILDNTTHKRLNFGYNNDNLVAWYKFNGDYFDSSGNGHNLTNVGTVIQSTHIIEGQAVEFDSTDYLEFPATINPYTIWNGKGITFSCWVRFTAHETNAVLMDFQPSLSSSSGILIGFKTTTGGNKALLIIVNTITVFNWSDWNNPLIATLNVWRHLVFCVDVAGKWDVYLDNVRINGTETANIPNITYNFRFINRTVWNSTVMWDGQMDDFRIYDRALSAADVTRLYNKTYPAPSNTYTLNFPVPTLADINNNSNIVLRGAYDIALNTRNAIVIPKTGQYIPQPTTFTNYSVERMYPPVRNFSAATTLVSGQTYGNGTYIVTYSSTYGENLDPFKCFNTSDGTGGCWALNRYTAGVFNSTSFIVAGYLGDWIKIQLPVAIKLTRFEFLLRIGFSISSPKDFKIYGSNDNITWFELVNKTDAVYNASNKYEQATPEITNAYTYYGLVVNKLLGSTGATTTLNFDEWYIYGQEVLPSSLSIRYNLLNPTQDPIGAQWTYNSSNMNVYHMGSVGVGTTNPEYHLDVSGSLNAKTLMYNGSSVNSLGLSVGMIAQVQHLTYTKMELKDNTGWDAINEDLTSGFVIKITPKSSLSKMLVNLIVFIGMSTSADNAWWGIKLYRKIGTGSWTEITGCNGTETGSAAATAGTPVWISNNAGMITYYSSITNASGTYLDSPNTTATVYYTAYWNQRIGDNPSVTGQMFLNRASSQDDAYRPAPSSSWTVEEIWYG